MAEARPVLFVYTHAEAVRIKARRPELRDHVVVTSMGRWHTAVGLVVGDVVESHDAVLGGQWRQVKQLLEYGQAKCEGGTWTVLGPGEGL